MVCDLPGATGNEYVHFQESHVLSAKALFSVDMPEHMLAVPEHQNLVLIPSETPNCVEPSKRREMRPTLKGFSNEFVSWQSPDCCFAPEFTAL